MAFLARLLVGGEKVPDYFSAQVCPMLASTKPPVVSERPKKVS